MEPTFKPTFTLSGIEIKECRSFFNHINKKDYSRKDNLKLSRLEREIYLYIEPLIIHNNHREIEYVKQAEKLLMMIYINKVKNSGKLILGGYNTIFNSHVEEFKKNRVISVLDSDAVINPTYCYLSEMKAGECRSFFEHINKKDYSKKDNLKLSRIDREIHLYIEPIFQNKDHGEIGLSQKLKYIEQSDRLLKMIKDRNSGNKEL